MLCNDIEKSMEIANSFFKLRATSINDATAHIFQVLIVAHTMSLLMIYVLFVSISWVNTTTLVGFDLRH